MRNEEKQRFRRRFFDELEQRIGARPVEVFGAVDDTDPVAPCPRRTLEQADHPPHVVRADFCIGPLGFLVLGTPQQTDVGMR